MQTPRTPRFGRSGTGGAGAGSADRAMRLPVDLGLCAARGARPHPAPAVRCGRSAGNPPCEPPDSGRAAAALTHSIHDLRSDETTR